MAGIGFELQKALKEGGITSFLKVALTGMIIVAGPWIISIIGIFIINNFAGSALKEGQELFMLVVIYSYAFSLVIFGGSHYIFTRFISDLMFKENKKEAASSLLIFSLLILILSSIISFLGLSGISSRGISHPLMFKLSAWLFFTSINILWILMIFISLLKRYMVIFIIFISGMSLSVICVSVLGNMFGLGGAMLGFSLGQFLTVVFLFIISFIEFKPGNIFKALRNMLTYFPRYRNIFYFPVLFYYWSIWIDKMVFWFFAGQRVERTFFNLFNLYDIPVYISNLTMIPGLIYFIVICETNFYSHLKEFLESLSTNIYNVIQKKKYFMISKMKEGLREQSLFQGVLTLILIISAPSLIQFLFKGSVDIGILRMTLLAVFFSFFIYNFNDISFLF